MISNIEKLKREATELFQISNILNGKFDVDKSKFIVTNNNILKLKNIFRKNFE